MMTIELSHIFSCRFLQVFYASVVVVGAHVAFEVSVHPAFDLVEPGGVLRQIEGGYFLCVFLKEMPGLPAAVDGCIVHDKDDSLQSMPLCVPQQLL